MCAGAAIATAIAAGNDAYPTPASLTTPKAHAAPLTGIKVAKTSSTPTPPKHVKPKPPEPTPNGGDVFLNGSIDLATAKKVGARLWVDLGDERRARLTLRPELQDAANKILDRSKAHIGAIAMIARDGRILALAGRRTLAPAKKRAPELALEVWAPAASIFKIVTSAALIRAGVRPDTPVCYHGGVRSVRESNLRDIPAKDTKCEDLSFGFAKSQNAIFAKLANRHLDAASLRRAAGWFGFGEPPKFALPMDASRAAIPRGRLDRARVAAGFWNSEISPLAGALMANTIATGGVSVTPRIVSSVSDGKRTVKIDPVPPRRTLPPGIARKVRGMMIRAVDKGTARRGFHDRKGHRYLPGVKIAGKTGSLSKRRNKVRVMYSWFVGFAPADKPRVSVAVLLGNPEKWHIKASSAARIMLEHALTKKRVRKKATARNKTPSKKVSARNKPAPGKKSGKK